MRQKGGISYSRRLFAGFLLPVLFLIYSVRSDAQRYPFFNIGIEQGLIQSQVFALAQDNSGHLWCGTIGGLSCYDGQAFRSFTVREGLPANTITALRCARNGLLWIGTSGGLSSYDGHGFRNFHFSAPENPGGNAVRDVVAADDGTVWCIAGKSLYRLNNGKVEAVSLPGSYPVVAAIMDDHAGGIWAAMAGAGSLFRLGERHWDSSRVLDHGYIYDIYRDRNDRLILLSSNGMYRNDEGGWNLVYATQKPKEARLLSFSEAHDGSYWMSSSAGAIQVDGDDVRYFTKQNGLTDVMVETIITDREGNIWFGTNGEGIFRFSGATFTAVDERMGLTGPQVSSIARDAQGTVYFGSYDGGLYRYRDNKVTPVPFPVSGMRRPVTSLLIRGNTMYIGTQNSGIWRYDLSRNSMSHIDDDNISPVVPAMLQDVDGIWAGGIKGLVKIPDGAAKSILIKTPALEAMTKIGRDSLLLSTNDGLMLYARDNIYRFMTGSGADSGQIVCMDFRDGILWLGTIDNGVFGYQISTGKSIHISRRNGLRSDFIYNIYAAPDNKVWAGTGYGICSIRADWLRPTVTFYGRNAGLVGMESNRNAVYPLPDGKIWFGTTGGALLYHPESPTAVANPGSLQLQGLQLFGEPIRDSSWFQGVTGLYNIPLDMRLPWRKNNLTFSFQAVSLTGNDGILYRYRLAGLNAPWSEWSTNKTVNFSALPPGNYALEVQCSTDGINVQPQTLHYDFEIITPFYKTTLFKLLILAACILLGVTLQYIAARRKRARHAMIEALRREEQAKVRQRTAEDFHDEVGNKLTRINVLTNVLRSKIQGAAPDATRIIDQIQDNAGQLYSGTRDILWSLQPSNDTLYQVLQRIGDFGRDLFGDTEIGFSIQGIDPAWKDIRLPMDVSRNLIMIFKEALNNALKYAMADEIKIYAASVSGNLLLTLKDDGKGFDQAQISRGQGLINMKTRANRLGGELRIDAECGRGTSIELTLKIPSNKG